MGVPVRVSVNIGGSAVPYDHKGGAVDEEDVRRFCRERLKAHLSLGDTSALGLLENLWPSCRKTLLAELPRAIEEAGKDSMTLKGLSGR